MSFRTVVISQQSKLDLRMGYLVIRQGGATKRVFLDEINTLIVENPACCVTGCLLAEMVRKKIKIIFCDEKHSPVSELLPCYGNTDCSGRLREQLCWSPVFCRHLWTNIVRMKIQKQAAFLSELGHEADASRLNGYVAELEEGDVSNREGHAAKVYFNVVFGKNFKRGDGGAIDSALNYGYALLLASFNREIVACGFSTQLGLSHHNEFNYYNLSCDLMEPFRILIDRHVHACSFDEFFSREKHKVLDIYNQSFLLNGTMQRLDNCIRLYVHSVFKAIKNSDEGAMKNISWPAEPVYACSHNED